MKTLFLILIALSILGCEIKKTEENSIPYPTALYSAIVLEDSLNDPQRKSLVLGNGDLNALLFSKGESLKLRISKNDVWDARIETSEDPPMVRFDVKNHSWEGGASRIPSWHEKGAIPICGTF